VAELAQERQARQAAEQRLEISRVNTQNFQRLLDDNFQRMKGLKAEHRRQIIYLQRQLGVAEGELEKLRRHSNNDKRLRQEAEAKVEKLTQTLHMFVSLGGETLASVGSKRARPNTTAEEAEGATSQPEASPPVVNLVFEDDDSSELANVSVPGCKTTKKRRKRRQRDKRKGTVSGRNLFIRDSWRRLQDAGKAGPFGETNKRIAQEWREMTPEQKRPYEEQAVALRATPQAAASPLPSHATGASPSPAPSSASATAAPAGASSSVRFILGAREAGASPLPSHTTGPSPDQ
jgi:hypothetical protein